MNHRIQKAVAAVLLVGAAGAASAFTLPTYSGSVLYASGSTAIDQALQAYFLQTTGTAGNNDLSPLRYRFCYRYLYRRGHRSEIPGGRVRRHISRRPNGHAGWPSSRSRTAVRSMESPTSAPAAQRWSIRYS
jgi:hypothetical protein